MKTVNIHEAKTHLSRLIEQAVDGEPFVIARAGTPLVQVVALDESTRITRKRIGFLAGQGRIPEDFDTMGQADIESLFSSSR